MVRRLVADPFRLDFKNFALRADLGATRTSVEGQTEFRIVVEIKSFAGNSFVSELQQAIGQYQMYQDALILNQLDHTLYLGISTDAYKDYFLQSGAEFAVQRYHIRLLIVDTDQEEISQWIE